MLQKSTSHIDKHPDLTGPMFQPSSITASLHNASPDRSTAAAMLDDDSTPTEWSEEDIVLLHWRLLQEINQLADPATPLEDKFDKVQVGHDIVVITDDGMFHEGCLYIPKDETSGEAVRQASAFTNEHDQFMESDLDADRQALIQLVRLLRCVDSVQTLDSLLQQLQLGRYPKLHGKCFQLEVGSGGQPGYSLELIG